MSLRLPGFACVTAEFAAALHLADALWFGHSLGGYLLMDSRTLLPSPAALAIHYTAAISAR